MEKMSAATGSWIIMTGDKLQQMSKVRRGGPEL